MNSRISTAGIHNQAIARMLSRQSDLAFTQNQMATGKRVNTPSDDPVAATQIMDMQRQKQQIAQYVQNGDAANARLSTTEQAFADLSNSLNRIRELTLQAGSPAMDSAARKAIVSELTTRTQEVQDIANRRDANGEYLFSGLSTQTQPFARGANGVDYSGDQGTRVLQIGPDQQIADGFSGEQVFRSITQGNGTFVVSQGVHVGASSIDTGQVTNAGAWVPGNYSLEFTAADTWQVLDANSNVVTSGPYVSGAAIAFNGVQVAVSGTPETGDTYSISAAGKEDIFTTLDSLTSSLSAAVDNPVGRADLTSSLAKALVQLDQGLTNAQNLRAETGTRLSALDSAATVRQQLADELTGSVGKLQDLDYAEATGRMNQQMLGLQAAQAAYGRIAQLSLFSYL